MPPILNDIKDQQESFAQTLQERTKTVGGKVTRLGNIRGDEDSLPYLCPEMCVSSQVLAVSLVSWAWNWPAGNYAFLLVKSASPYGRALKSLQYSANMGRCY